MLVLLLNDAIPLKGFYRVRPGQPGFAIPVFKDNGQLVVQRIDTKGTIDGFLPCDLDVEQLLPVPKDIGEEPLDSRVGTEPLYGFQNLDGTLIYGSRDKLLPLLRSVSAQLADRPFLSLEIAQFLEDEVLINENRARTRSLLRRRARDPIVSTPLFFDRLSGWMAGLFPSLALQASYSDGKTDEVVKTFPSTTADPYKAQLVQDSLGRWFLRVFTEDVDAAKLKVRLEIEPEGQAMQFIQLERAMFFAEVRLSERMAAALKSGRRILFRAID